MEKVISDELNQICGTLNICPFFEFSIGLNKFCLSRIQMVGHELYVKNCAICFTQ